eukprot:473753-Prymnesium_polylepis.1
MDCGRVGWQSGQLRQRLVAILCNGAGTGRVLKALGTRQQHQQEDEECTRPRPAGDEARRLFAPVSPRWQKPSMIEQRGSNAGGETACSARQHGVISAWRSVSDPVAKVAGGPARASTRARGRASPLAVCVC